MTITQKYPLEMVHPAFDAGSPARFKNNSGELLPPGIVSGTMVSEGRASRNPPVTVSNQRDEEYHRSLGYLAKGETPTKVEGFFDYPKMLVHPDHVAGTPDEIHAKPREEGKAIETFTVKGTPEKFPPVIVNNAEEESAWNAKGYHMSKLPDPDSFQRSRSVPYVPGRTVNGYPRWENGVLVNDPSLNSAGVKEYPKWVGDKLVNSAKEELELLGHGDLTDAKINYLIGERRHLSEIGDDAGVERIENMLAEGGIEVKDRPHGTTWRRVEKAEEPEPELFNETKNTPSTKCQPPSLTTERQAEKADLLTEAEARGIKVDGRWSIEKIRAALDQAAA